MTQEKNIRFHTKAAIQNLVSAAEAASKESSSEVDASKREELIARARQSANEVLSFLESKRGDST